MPENNVYDTVVNQGLQIGAQLMMRGMAKQENTDYADKLSRLSADIIGKILPAKARKEIDENGALRATIEAGQAYGLNSVESTGLLNQMFTVISKMQKDGANMKDVFQEMAAIQRFQIGELTKAEKESGFYERAEKKFKERPEYQTAKAQFDEFKKSITEISSYLSEALRLIQNGEDKTDKIMKQLNFSMPIGSKFSRELRDAIETMKKNPNSPNILDAVFAEIEEGYTSLMEQASKKSAPEKTSDVKKNIADKATIKLMEF